MRNELKENELRTEIRQLEALGNAGELTEGDAIKLIELRRQLRVIETAKQRCLKW